MVRNYLVIALRNLRKYKGFSVINIAGLAIGMACCLLILLFVVDELSYDRFHEKADRIYRIQSHSTIGGTTRKFARSPASLAPAAAESIPEVEHYVRIFQFGDTRYARGGKEYTVSDFYIVDEDFFKIFTHEFITGDPETALAAPNSLVITENTAIRIFGDTQVVGETLSPPGPQGDPQGGQRRLEFRVTGVVKNVPKNSHLRFNVLLSSRSVRYNNPNNDPGFLEEPYFFLPYSYLLLKPGSDPADVKAKLMTVNEMRFGELLKQRGVVRDYPLWALKDIHLRSHYESELSAPGSITYVYLFAAIALLVLCIASFNFINLSTARSTNRAREVGLRKVFGAYRKHLVGQFLSESIVVSLIALVFGVAGVQMVLPIFNRITGKEFDALQLSSLTFAAGILGVVILTGLVAGSFPAFILSSFLPIKTIRGRLGAGTKKATLRKILVVLQFSISIFMIVGIIVILKQLEYVKNKDLGFDREQIVVLRGSGPQNEAFKEKLLQNPRITSVSFSRNVPGQFSGDDTLLPQGKPSGETFRASAYWVGYDFLKTYGMKILWGRDFAKEFPSDAERAVLINETAAREIGWGEDAVGKQLVNVSREDARVTVIGVVSDFHHKSLKQAINPIVIALDPGRQRYVSLKIEPRDLAGTLNYMEDVWKEFYPRRNFTFYFLDDDFRSKYQPEERVQEVYVYFGILAICVACLGLYGLTSFTTEQRTKEIGIRKVMGASLGSIVITLSKEFLKWVLVANLIAWPVSYYIMNNWLNEFAYRIAIGWWIFGVSALIALTVAFFTVGHQALRSAISNPSDSLRYE